MREQSSCLSCGVFWSVQFLAVCAENGEPRRRLDAPTAAIARSKRTFNSWVFGYWLAHIFIRTLNRQVQSRFGQVTSRQGRVPEVSKSDASCQHRHDALLAGQRPEGSAVGRGRRTAQTSGSRSAAAAFAASRAGDAFSFANATIESCDRTAIAVNRNATHGTLNL